MSKAFAFAGPRSATSPRDPAVVDALRLVRLPYHLSALTQAAARAALAHADELLGTVERAAGQRDRLVDGLRAHRARRSPTPTRTSCCSAGSPTRHAVWQALLDRGVLVRETSARRAGCGSPPARRTETTRSSTPSAS